MLQVNKNAGNLSNLQLELIKSMNYVVTEKQLDEIKSLLSFYFEQQLDAAIEEVKSERGYSQATYESWLKNSTATRKNI